MEVTESLVAKLALLSRLQFSADEQVEIRSDLRKMIDFVEKLNELDINGVAPLLHLSEETNVLREDELRGSVSVADSLKNAPAQDGQFFNVPKVIQK